MKVNHFFRSARGVCAHVFVRYGAGGEFLRPITQTKWWNAACWILIVLGMVGWAIFIFWPY